MKLTLLLNIKLFKFKKTLKTKINKNKPKKTPKPVFKVLHNIH